jgi:hypothetical protein
MVACPACDGAGDDRFEEPCFACGGDGVARPIDGVDWVPWCVVHGDTDDCEGGCFGPPLPDPVYDEDPY